MKRILTCLAALCMVFSLGCKQSDEPAAPAPTATELTRYEGSFIDVFDTVTKVIIYDKNEALAKEHIQSIHDELADCHKLYDIYNSYDGVANLRTINENAGIGPVKVDQRIIDLIVYAKEAYTLTSGTMNIAMGSVLSIWHDYREAGVDNPEQAALPEMAALQKAAEHMDLNRVIVDQEAGTVYLEDPSLRLDVGAIAKGYAAQLVVDDMRSAGVKNLLLSVGGNVCAIGKRADGKDWKVGIQSPDDPAGNLCYVGVEDRCLVTSGSYQRYYTVDGVRYHHIIDPETLYPSVRYASVSVLCADSALADALSTALFNMPLDEGRALVKSQTGVEVMWVEPDGTITYSDGFENDILPE